MNADLSPQSLKQLATLAELDQLLKAHRIAYWLFGGWAVDFHARRVTRPHDDIDIAVWADDAARLASLLDGQGWTHTPDADDDGYTSYERDGVRLEVALLDRDEKGIIYTPLRDGRGEWPSETFGDDVVELRGVSLHVVRLQALIADKSLVHGDASVAAKDRADLVNLEAAYTNARSSER